MTTLTTDISKDIRTADDVFERHFREGNAAGLSDLYTNDGTLLPIGSDFIQGKDAIRDFWQTAMNAGIKEVKLDILETDRQGDAIIEVGRYQLKGAGGEVVDWGKYIVIWKQEQESWKVHRDIWNSSRTA